MTNHLFVGFSWSEWCVQGCIFVGREEMADLVVVALRNFESCVVWCTYTAVFKYW